jgi:hypothetical protein
MAQTSVEWIYYELVVFMTGNSDFESAEELLKHCKAMHKVDCLSFAEEWEIRCNEKNMDSKEQLYDEIYNKQ